MLTACSTMGHGPISEPVVGIGAALLAALDSLLANKVLTPEQYLPLATGVKGISESIATAVQTVQDVQQQVAAEKASKWTPGEVCTVGGTLAAAAAAAGAKLTSAMRDRNYTPEELAERKIKRIKAAVAKKVA